MTNPAEVSGPRRSLFKRGLRRIKEFCRVNRLIVPEVVVVPKEEWEFVQHAYYRLGKQLHGVIKICVERCARPATPEWVRNWNWPGSKIDATPYGILAHELGHHADVMRSGVKNPRAYKGTYSRSVFDRGREPALTPYNGTNGKGGPPMKEEFFAEAFRLFVTNPALLAFLRPRTFDVLWRQDGWTPLGKDRVHDLPAGRTVGAAGFAGRPKGAAGKAGRSWERGLARGCPDRVLRSLERATTAAGGSKAR